MSGSEMEVCRREVIIMETLLETAAEDPLSAAWISWFTVYSAKEIGVVETTGGSLLRGNPPRREAPFQVTGGDASFIMEAAVSNDILDCVEVEPVPPARSSVIWLHGLGASGHDFETILPLLDLPEDHEIRFLFPHAPAIPVSLNQGMVMRAWYDIKDPGLGRDHDMEGLRRSDGHLRRLIAREQKRGIPLRRIVLAGFSQGGAVVLYSGLRYEQTLAGIMALSTYLVDEESLEDEATQANAQTPIFIAHGTADPMVPFTKGEEARSRLMELGYQVEWHSYPMQHEVSPAEIEEIGAWIVRVLA